MAGFQTVATLEDLPEGSLLSVDANGARVVLANDGGQVYALDDCCSHEQFPLSDGELEDGQLTCLLHGARFDLGTGVPTALPAVRPVKTYEVRLEGDEIQICLD